VRDILARHGLPITAVVGHSDVSPGRKADPGELFPWETLAKAGAALWPEPVSTKPGPALAKAGDAGGHVANLQEALAGIGYGVPVSGDYCEATQACVGAFQRRFRPARVDGALDAHTLDLVSAVLDVSLRLSLPRRTS